MNIPGFTATSSLSQDSNSSYLSHSANLTDGSIYLASCNRTCYTNCRSFCGSDCSDLIGASRGACLRGCAADCREGCGC